MGKRKGLNDVLSNDRSVARAAQGLPHYSMSDRDDDSVDGGWNPAVKSSTTKSYGVCADTHPPLPIKVGDVTYTITGGAASHPVANANVLVALQGGTPISFHPWNGKMHLNFPIADMGTPKSPEEFKKMISFVADLLVKGYRVHVGCIGGHGRTGMILSALVKHMTGEEDAITYVRANYCERAVESKSQVDFLAKHFGIKPVTGFKEGKYTSHSGKSSIDLVKPSGHNDRILPLDRTQSIYG